MGRKKRKEEKNLSRYTASKEIKLVIFLNSHSYTPGPVGFSGEFYYTFKE
jgi:hypothetical protein